ncbi:DUF2382 domain-containing protein [Methylobacterium iners]|uniref:DUF2382 domain-containing protein n=1 Tax=Methylobacterium iners TaxID=418707 RepID=A0ABQ4RZ35_9HYPH|nr:DUF2382 domain-containing protein [Methylobacterium iners]GJD96110.1 hypothetical protein OCOJLMKI_3328 [Methylobacterium iners]
MTQTVTAMFDNRSDAEAAIQKLTSAGVAGTAIRLLPETAPATTTTTTASSAYDHRRDERGLWSSLKDALLPDEDRYTYAEGMNRGGTMLTVSAEEGHISRVLDILEEHGAVDLDEREASWRKEGWSGYSAAGSTSTAQATGRTGSTGDTESIPVVEERLNVGKRATELGRVRVRSYVVETPVTEQVTLHNETVQVERRPVNRAATSTDEALFAEKTIEATTRSEQAVVSKEARVVEEVGLRKDATERTETVSDTVRRTEVEVEDERGQVSRTGTTDPATRK